MFFNLSCLNKKTDENEKSGNQPDRPISVLMDLALNKGDIRAYQELGTAYLDYEHGEFYEFAKRMANEHDYPGAFYDVYVQILKPTDNPETTISLDSCTLKERNEAIYYLKKSFEKGFEPAELELEYLKEKGFIK